MIKVYYESNSHAELVAIFVDKEMYDICLPSLMKNAKDNRMFVTESIQDELNIDDLK